jgi:shikimate dehydrogenase
MPTATQGRPLGQSPSRRSVLLGLIGSHIGASKSPPLHEAEAARQGLQLVYRLVDFEQRGLVIPDLGDLLRWAEHFGFDGFNVTHPYKSAIIPLLHSMSPEAAAMGAANTVVLRDGHRAGHNTDWFGFAEGLRRGLPGVAQHTAAQIGAGGAGAATAYAMLSLGTHELVIFDIDLQHATDLQQRLRNVFPDRSILVAGTPEDAVSHADGVVLATPVGSAGCPGVAFDPRFLQSRHWVADVIYAPLETQMLAHARSIGCRTLNGSGMLTFQAVQAFKLFTDHEADADAMLATFRRCAGQPAA